MRSQQLRELQVYRCLIIEAVIAQDGWKHVAGDDRCSHPHGSDIGPRGTNESGAGECEMSANGGVHHFRLQRINQYATYQRANREIPPARFGRDRRAGKLS